MNPLLFFFNLSMHRRLKAFRKALANPAEAQFERLRAVTSANAQTVFGKEHGFARIDNFGDYRKAVPIRPYDEFAPYIERIKKGEQRVLTSAPVEMFSITSGTSAEPKFCPVTRPFTLEHHGAHLMWMLHFSNDHPQVTKGKYLSIVSPAESGRTVGGIPFGASSGKQYLNQAIPVRRKHPVPYEAFTIKDYSARYHAVLLFCLGEKLYNVTSVNPSTLVILAHTLRDRAASLLDDLARGSLDGAGDIEAERKRRLELLLRPNPARARMLEEILKRKGELLPKDVWPDLQAMVTWQGGSAPFYLSQLDGLWGKVPRRCLGLRASEGTFSIPLRDNDPSGVIAVNGHIMEFTEEHEDVRADSPTL
ncbi:MAG: GH3 auxin-responsive promoter family protein, partial [Planctomycetes bacterium]|nr:GH3 auxin-responsive promoter family protein [Planctomycetota bacterium]